MSVIQAIDESKLDIEKLVGEEEKVTVNLKKEITFARDLHPKACVGLDVAQQPPNPDVWFGLVDGENYGDRLLKNWEDMKVNIIGEIEQKDHPEPEKQEAFCSFLESTTACYMDLMCSIWVNFKDELLEHTKVVECDDSDDKGKEEIECDDDCRLDTSQIIKELEEMEIKE